MLEEWRANPVTEWFMGFLEAEMTRTKQSFQDRAWEGDLSEVAHATHRERYETLDWLRGLDMQTIDETLEKQE